MITSAPPSVLPVSLYTALRQMRALTEDADMVSFYLQAATERVEDYTGRALISRSFTLRLPSWPSLAYSGGLRGAVPSSLFLELRRSPLVSVTSVKYYPEDGGAQATLNSSNYKVHTFRTPGGIEFNDKGADLPALAIREDAVEVVFVAGQGTLEHQISPLLRQAVLLLARHYYDNRMPVDSDKLAIVPMSIRDILRSQRVESLTPLSS